MADEYFIEEDTLIIMPISKTQTKVITRDGDQIINKRTFDIVDESCQYYGSSYGGRYLGSKKILNMDYKLPIIVDELKEVVLFPTCSPKQEKCMWISVNTIANYHRFKKGSIIKFTNGKVLELDLSFNTLENQIMRATMLLMKLKKRKNGIKNGLY